MRVFEVVAGLWAGVFGSLLLFAALTYYVHGLMFEVYGSLVTAVVVVPMPWIIYGLNRWVDRLPPRVDQ